jgi:hypothetical protein
MCPNYMELEGSLVSSQKPDTGPYPELSESSPRQYTSHITNFFPIVFVSFWLLGDDSRLYSAKSSYVHRAFFAR